MHESVHIPEIILNIIRARGIDEDMTEEFFSPRPQLAYDPFLLSEMKTGVDLLLDAVDSGKRIVIYGDYDVDGITSTSLLMKVIGTLTDNVSCQWTPCEVRTLHQVSKGYSMSHYQIGRAHV